MTAACKGLKKLGLEIGSRPFVYSDTPQLVLDSFLLYTHATNYRVSESGLYIIIIIYLNNCRPNLGLYLLKLNIYLDSYSSSDSCFHCILYLFLLDLQLGYDYYNIIVLLLYNVFPGEC